jgi:F420-non-reducing hydrogenase iron-sulfur subunit
LTASGSGWNGSRAEGYRFAEVVEEFTKELQEMGPNPLKGGEW